MWTRAPAWVVIVKDILCFLTGLGGMVFLMFTNSSNVILILAALSLIGIPGASAVLALISGQQPQGQPNSQTAITGSSSQSQSQSSSH